MSLVLIHPAPDSGWAGQRLNGVLRQALAGKEVRVLRTAEELTGIAGERLLLALPLGDTGINLEYMRMLVRLRKERSLLQGCTAGLIVDGAGELYTKSAAAEAALALNRAGCALVGRPLVEGTGSLANFQVQANNLGVDLMGAYRHAAQELAERVEGFVFPKKERPEVLTLHASSHHTSNTMDLWSQVREKLEERCAIREIGLRNGTLSDCSGCPYTMCLHFGEQGGC
ncbi:MAG: NADPH-dependent oxidoreductase, partial [Lawsonibacter sp.]|nr:NADPH-dependent oxidoreductase [Lawsonibacter sp.]